MNKLLTGTKCFIGDNLDVNPGPFGYDNANASGFLSKKQEIFAILLYPVNA